MCAWCGHWDVDSNARLIAAAPELLAAAKRVAEDDDIAHLEKLKATCRSAIAKAEGR